MSNTMFFSLLLNIGLLVLIATMLTKIPVVRSMLLGENNLIGSRAPLQSSSAWSALSPPIQGYGPRAPL